MRILINTSNLKIGGGLQVAHSFLDQIKKNENHQFTVILSSVLAKQINQDAYSANFQFFIYDVSPSVLKIVKGNDSFLDNLINIESIQVVFSIFGPSNWRPRTKHLLGIANGWWYYPDSPAWLNIPLHQKIKKKIIHCIQIRQILREGDCFIVETEDAKRRISKYFKVGSKKIKVVGNTYNQIFNSFYSNEKKSKSNSNDFKFITVCAYYPHKNLKIIPKVILELRKRRIHNIKFYLTIPQELYNQNFVRYSEIINLGPQPIEKLPALYDKMDAAFIPTLLETFSASYPEAMKMHLPILTSNLSFAKDICGNAAEFFDPLDPKCITKKIVELMENRSRQAGLIENGINQLNKFETSESRALNYLKICEEIGGA